MTAPCQTTLPAGSACTETLVPEATAIRVPSAENTIAVSSPPATGMDVWRFPVPASQTAISARFDAATRLPSGESDPWKRNAADPSSRTTRREAMPTTPSASPSWKRTRARREGTLRW